MKKFIAILLALLMLLSLSACGSKSSEDTPTGSQPPVSAQEPASSPAEEENDVENPSSEDDAEYGSSILVAYFSRSGNTVWEDGVDAVTSASIN